MKFDTNNLSFVHMSYVFRYDFRQSAAQIKLEVL
jgi:hypothetical protein